MEIGSMVLFHEYQGSKLAWYSPLPAIVVESGEKLTLRVLGPTPSRDFSVHNVELDKLTACSTHKPDGAEGQKIGCWTPLGQTPTERGTEPVRIFRGGERAPRAGTYRRVNDNPDNAKA